MLNPWLAIALVLIILLGLMVALRLVQYYFSPHPEVVRKLLHIPMGLLTLTFPWLFHTSFPVVLLAIFATAWLTLLRIYKPLRQTLGSVLGGVERRSLGELYFSIAVAILFVLSDGNAILFCIPMLILTLADAMAALVGVTYGKLHYAATDGQKSAEGSLAFFTLAFFSTHIPLLLATDTGRAESLLIAVIIGLLVMLLEAIAWLGLDNLFIPLGGFILLKTHLEMDVPALLLRLAITVVLVGLVLLWRQRTTLTDSALLGAIFVGYLSWLLGGWLWLVAPLVLLISYPFLIQRIDQEKTPLTPLERQVMIWLPTEPGSGQEGKRSLQWERVHNIYAVLSVVAAGLLWLGLFSIFEQPKFIYPYTLSFAANLAVIGVAGLSPQHYWQRSNWLKVAVYILKGWLLTVTPLVIIQGWSFTSLAHAIWGLAGVALAAIAYYLTQPLLHQRPLDTMNWVCRAAYTTVGSLLALLPV
jgi:phytol kinase